MRASLLCTFSECNLRVACFCVHSVNVICTCHKHSLCTQGRHFPDASAPAFTGIPWNALEASISRQETSVLNLVQVVCLGMCVHAAASCDNRSMRSATRRFPNVRERCICTTDTHKAFFMPSYICAYTRLLVYTRAQSKAAAATAALEREKEARAQLESRAKTLEAQVDAAMSSEERLRAEVSVRAYVHLCVFD